MILLTRFDNTRLLVNLETVKFIESTPDTLVVFVNGDSVFVREPLEEVERRVLDYRVRTLQQAGVDSSAPR